ncbi:MAG: lysophospholipid acyltransferase family protein, partial [Dysgonamonadaceae bacterium]|jgi:KDO2-lipid IV(A) lauroyltransferase|nr:lysophospholipid acyltransferase family protein [Dysgonamonadaceae bacterium]
MHATEHTIRYGLLKGMWRLLAFIPLPILYGLSDILFYMVYHLARYRRRITRKNLIESFPEKSRREITGIEKRFYRFFVDLMFEMCKMTAFSEQEMRRRMRFTHLEEVQQVLDSGKSISVYIGHYGNWEWISSLPVHLSGPVVAGQIYHRLHNRAVNRLLLRNRSQWGSVNVEMNETFRWIHRHFYAGQVTITGYIADQAPRSANVQHHVHFLNHQTTALTGTEKITRKYGFDAYYLDIERKRRGYYEARFVRMPDDETQALSGFALTDKYFELLEQTIRRRPECYLWTHNRFKHPTTKLLQDIQL